MLFITAILATPFAEGEVQSSDEKTTKSSTTRILPEVTPQLEKDYDLTVGFFSEFKNFIEGARALQPQKPNCDNIPEADRKMFKDALNNITGYKAPDTCATVGLQELCAVANMGATDYAKIESCGKSLGDVFGALSDSNLEKGAQEVKDCVSKKDITDTEFAKCVIGVTAGFQTYSTAYKCIAENPTISGGIKNCATEETKKGIASLFRELNKLPGIFKQLVADNVKTDNADVKKLVTAFEVTMDNDEKTLNQESEKAAKSADVGASFISVQAGTVVAVVASALAIFLA